MAYITRCFRHEVVAEAMEQGVNEVMEIHTGLLQEATIEHETGEEILNEEDLSNDKEEITLKEQVGNGTNADLENDAEDGLE